MLPSLTSCCTSWHSMLYCKDHLFYQDGSQYLNTFVPIIPGTDCLYSVSGTTKIGLQYMSCKIEGIIISPSMYPKYGNLLPSALTISKLKSVISSKSGLGLNCYKKILTLMSPLTHCLLKLSFLYHISLQLLHWHCQPSCQLTNWH